MQGVTYILNFSSTVLKWSTYLLCYLFCFTNQIQATHIVGGNIAYTCLGDNFYEITLTFRRDCKLGEEPYDSLAYIGVYYGDLKPVIPIGRGKLVIPYSGSKNIDSNVNNICIGPGAKVCVEEAVYKTVVYLEYDPRGYKIIYQRCCRNNSLSNIIDPLNTGSTYIAEILPSSMQVCNSTTVFKEFPPIYVCVGEQFTFDHSAIDKDGDSLVYSLCVPWQGRIKIDPQGFPLFPIEPVDWKVNHGISNMLGPGGTALQINATTGLLTAIPANIGQYVIGVCVQEYRKGKLLNTHLQDCELNIVPCGIQPEAKLVVNSKLCDGLQTSFTSNSVNTTRVTWFFDFPNSLSDTSNLVNTTHKYPKAGAYTVILVARNGFCTDTERININLIDPNLIPDFTYKVACDSTIKISTRNISQHNYPLTNILWRASNGATTQTSTNNNADFEFKTGGTFQITLTITDSFGCTANITKSVNADFITVELIEDQTICYGDSIRIVKNPNSNLQYTWRPNYNIILRPNENPIVFPEISTRYYVTITDGSCIEEDSVLISVRNKVNLSIIGDTTTCSGMITLIAYSDSTDVFMWSVNPNFNPLLSTNDTLEFKINGDTRIYIKAGEGDQCENVQSILLRDHSLRLDYEHNIKRCKGDTFKITLRNTDPTDTTVIIWTTSPYIIAGANTLMPTFFIPNLGRYVFNFTATNQHGCSLTDSIIIEIVDPPIPDFEIKTECGSLQIHVSTNASGGSVTWDFGDGIGTSNQPATNYTYTKSGRYRVTLTVDNVCIRSAFKDIVVVKINSNIQDTIISCNMLPVQLNPNGDTSYIYLWKDSIGLDNHRIPNPTASVNKNTLYIVEIRDSLFPECPLIDSVWVLVSPELVINLDYDSIICEAGKITILASSPTRDVQFVWCDINGKEIGRESMFMIDIQQSTRLILKAIDPLQCVTKRILDITLDTLDAKLIGPDEACVGDTLKLRILTTKNYTYNWEPKEFIMGSSTGAEITVVADQDRTYTCTLTSEDSCVYTLSKSIDVHTFNFNATATPNKILAGQTVQLDVIGAPSNVNYMWTPTEGLDNPNIKNPIATPSTTTIYTVKVTDAFGCMDTSQVRVFVSTCFESAFLPTAFSPNGDSKNPILYVRSPFIETMHLLIYDRWGEQVFESRNITDGWDGNYKKKRSGADVFGYVLTFTCFGDPKEYKKLGNVSIIK